MRKIQSLGKSNSRIFGIKDSKCSVYPFCVSQNKQRDFQIYINVPLAHVMPLVSQPMRASENMRFSDVFWEYRQKLAW